MVKLLNKNDDDDDAGNPSSAQIVASINDLLLEIIQRLSLKPLVQLKLVSNHWNSLTFDPKLCFLRNRRAVGLIFEGLDMGHGPTWYTTTDYPHTYIISLDKSISSPPIRKMTPTKDAWYRHCEIVHSCNGLLLCVSIRGLYVIRKYYVCNPTTRKYIELPQLVFDHHHSTTLSIKGMCLAFDPSKSPHYKVVCVLKKPFTSGLHLFEVYSSETGSWRKGGELFKSCAGFESFNFADGVYWNGAIHWVHIATTGSRESFYFGLDRDQTLKDFPKPPLQERWYCKNDYYFGESYDHLHFVDAKNALTELLVYEMKKDYSEWFLKYKVDVLVKYNFFVPEMKSNYFGNISRRYTVVRGKNDEDSFLVIATGKRIVRYNFEQKTCETLCDFETLFDFKSTAEGDGSVFWCSKRPFQYIESICSV